MVQSEGILPPGWQQHCLLFASRSSWEDSHVTHAGISLESLCGQAVSGLLDYSRPLDEAELLQLAPLSGSGSTPLGRWFVCLVVLTLAVTCTGWRGLGSQAEQSKPKGKRSLWL